MDNGNRKLIFSLLGIGVAIGIILSAIAGGIFHLITGSKSNETVLPVSPNVVESLSDTDSSDSIDTESEAISSEDASASSIPPTHEGDTWNKDTVYNGGEQVQYNGKIYQSKWWTQGDVPDSATEPSPWDCVGEAPKKETSSEAEEDIMNEPNVKPSDKKDGQFKVVGYYPDWEADKMDRIQYDVVTHIIYAFAIPKEDGTLRPLDNPSTAKKLIKQAHKNDTKVLIAIGGWSYNDIPLEPTFKAATNSDEKIDSLVKSIFDMVDEYGFDGVDVDWEHPRYGDVTQTQYEKLIVALNKETKKRNLLLTCAVLSGVSAEGTTMYDAAAHTDTVLNCLDWINVMAYDGGDGERHSSFDFAVNCGNYWKNTRKLPAEKVVLGVPFYGRPSWSTYDAILEINPDAYKTDITTVRGMEAHYNGIATIQKKTKWAKENVGGIMIWELSQDTTDKSKSLLSAIGKIAK